MPISISAKKSLRVSNRKRALNESRKRAMKEAVKEVKKSESGADQKVLLSKVYKAIDKAAKRGVIKKNTAARKKAQVARTLKEKNTKKTK